MFFSSGIPSFHGNNNWPLGCPPLKANTYMSGLHSTHQGLWLRRMLIEIGLELDGISTTIFIDNHGVIDLLKDSWYQQHTKHIDIQHHLIHEHIWRWHLQNYPLPESPYVSRQTYQTTSPRWFFQDGWQTQSHSVLKGVCWISIYTYTLHIDNHSLPCLLSLYYYITHFRYFKLCSTDT